jgi:hypothetical protein
MDGTEVAYRAVVVDHCAFSYGTLYAEKAKGLAKQLEARGVELLIRRFGDSRWSHHDVHGLTDSAWDYMGFD